ncbi:DUF924 family protein [Desertibaculum subflavum]|uniref:DUF924 family protein n=1 Tax=Desertibaculum subflavum TaxID=2268458 RepID=UPI000E65EE0C
MRPEDVLNFWFDAANKPFWFEKNDAFDADVTTRLWPLRDAAMAGKCADWTATPEGSLALVILLDQVPRNCCRGTAAAFASDAAARGVARQAIDRGFDRHFDDEYRLFFYLPFEHAEDVGAQLLSVALFAALPGRAEWLRYAERHAEIIARFGRFPHRNKALGRVSTAAEIAFLDEPMSSF